MKFLIITYIVIFAISSTICIQKGSDNSDNTVISTQKDVLSVKTDTVNQEQNKSSIKLTKNEKSNHIVEDKTESKNLKQTDIKFNEKDNNKISTKLKTSLSKNTSQKVEIKKLSNDEVYYAKCFIRFGNDFYDMSRIPEINVNADTENGNRDFKINMCKDIGTSCTTTGLGLQEKDCIVIAGDQKIEKSWIADGKKTLLFNQKYFSN